jgi:hypothetical protein
MIGPGDYKHYPFAAPAGSTNVFVTGAFAADYVGGGHDLEVLVMSQASFNNWRGNLRCLNCYQVTVYYNSSQAYTDTLNVGLPSAGSYDIVYSNTLSLTNGQFVRTGVNLYYVR